jgi:hypothetical protein
VVSLADGSSLVDVSVVSAGRGSVSSLWLDQDGVDLFVRKAEIVKVRELLTAQAA